MNKAIIEGLLFVSGDEGISLDKLCEITELSVEDITKVLDELGSDYEKDDRGILLKKLGNCYKLTTKDIHKQYYEKLVCDDSKFLTQASLETLAIIAYNEPITRVELDEIRGISCTHMIRRLLSRNFIKEVGRSNLPGKPILYGVTDEFLDYFGLSSIEDLPKIDEIESIDTEKDLFESRYKEQ